MESTNTEISNQLKSIKKWIMLGAFSLLLIALSAVVFSISMITAFTALESKYAEADYGKKDPDFSHVKVSSLLTSGEIEEALEIINKRLESHPSDSYAVWFKAKAYYLKKEWDAALELIDETESLAPTWKKEYTEPLRKQIQKNRP